MSKKWLFWWGANLFWLISFIIGATIIWFRNTDDANVIQTPELKLFSFLILIIIFSIPAIIQVVWFIINLLTNKKNLQLVNHYSPAFIF